MAKVLRKNILVLDGPWQVRIGEGETPQFRGRKVYQVYNAEHDVVNSETDIFNQALIFFYQLSQPISKEVYEGLVESGDLEEITNEDKPKYVM